MSSKFFTNENENTLKNKFEGITANNLNINHFDAVVGYLRASGYFEVQPFLQKMQKIRILVGINADKFIADAQAKGQLYLGSAEQTKEDFLNSVKQDIDRSEYSETVENGIVQFFDDIVEKRIELRAHPSRKIHAKIYILYPENFNEHTLDAAAITGSSNLTGNGLGIGNDRQYEFNVLLNDNEEVKFAKEEFEKLWAEGVAILPADIEKAKQETYLAGDVTPYELYVKMLIEYFGEDIVYRKENPYELPANFKKMEYQLDAAEDGYRKLLRFDGFFLSDVVGLGKTVVATMISKRFLYENGINHTKILVVYPPALEKNWKSTFHKFGIDHYAKFISNGSLEKVLNPDNYDYWNAEEYDLVLIDESHKYRNHETQTFRNLQEVCKCPRINQGKIEGRKKKVMLISATPLNNSPADIYYQIQLFQDPRQCTLDGVSNLTAFFSPKIVQYKQLKAAEKLDISAFKKLYEEIREKIIKPITVRRTRTDIENIERYRVDIEEFPKVQKPQKIEYKLDDKLAVLFEKTIHSLIDANGLQYSRYQAIANLIPEIQNKYYERAELVSKSLAYIMKTMLIKRLESSFFAFKNSLGKFQKANRNMIEMFEKGKIYIAPDLDINKFYEEDLSDEEIEERIVKVSEENPKNQIFKPEDFNSTFIAQLQNDRKILDSLVEEWRKIEQDPKLDEFLKHLESDFFEKGKNIGQKLVIFSESTDTVEYLKSKIARKDVLTIDASNRNKKFTIIEENFDANLPAEKQKNDYNIIISTEVLAEGVNLHRSNVIVNYDTPWNSTRLMQRIGRVNRIGSAAKNIYNYVFYPSQQGNAQINLVRTSFAKIQAFHTAFGEDNQIYSTEEIVDLNLDKLFAEGIPKEEANRELEYLEEIRLLKNANPKEYRRIEKMPLRCRTGRKANGNITKSSLVFLKTDKRKSFFRVDDEQCAELSALQALDLFKAEKDEPKIPRISEHHTHILRAENNFKTNIQSAYFQQNSATASGGQVNSALAFVRRFKPLQDNPEKQISLDRLLKIVEWGTISALTTGLNRMEKDAKNGKMNQQQCFDKITAMAEKYNTYYLDEQKEKKIEMPCIILSESFN